MVSVDVLLDDQSLADEIRAAVSGTGAQVSLIRGQTGALTGAEIQHIIQIIIEGLAYALIKDITLRLKDVLLSYWHRTKTSFSIIVDGIKYNITKDTDIDGVLNAIVEASERTGLRK